MNDFSSLICFFMIHSYLLTLFCQYMLHTAAAAAAYTLTPSQSIVDGQTLVSEDGTFELGFFSPSNTTKRRYVGIWYKDIPDRIVVWVANRDSPLLDTSGVLKISTTGNLVILNRKEKIVWSSNSHKTEELPVLEFLNTGNLVLRKDDSQTYLWQSFDHPGDTLLPGMKLGQNFKNQLHRYLSSWKNYDDPSYGDFTLEINVFSAGDFTWETMKYYAEPVVRNRRNIYFRCGLWNGIKNAGMPDFKNNTIFTYEVVSTEEEIYYIARAIDQSVLFRIVLLADGYLKPLIWVSSTRRWRHLLSFPKDVCDHYAFCGAYSVCDVTKISVCQCLKNFKPRVPKDMESTDWSHGCEREVSLNCSNREGFMKISGVKLPDTTTGATVARTNTDLKKCSKICLNNCSCMAYAASGDGSGCIMWYADLVDIRLLLNEAGSDLYIRLGDSKLDSIDDSNRRKTVIKKVSIIFSIGAIVLGLGSWGIRKRRPKDHTENDPIESPLYDLGTISSATNNFSEENKLGEGGFGPVYKGTLEGGEDIAVKRLSKNSRQGINEFMNEVILISKLQHRNLVRLLGCCIHGEEKMLVYEYMPNKSLDSFIFDEAKSRLLNWQKRLDIILGIARGLLYLHHDSRLRIIHRDLKAGNILLDREMVPKISDFGMARLFGDDQTEAQTTRVVGTYGYMSPEYAIDGKISMKSDVFSFGVLVLEIISSKRNRSFSHPEHGHNLLGHAWKLWKEDRSMELVDEWINDSFFAEDVLRCIQIGLLCVQKKSEQRPSMPDVVLMLSSETVVLPKPEAPGYYIERTTSSTASKDIESCVSNEMSIPSIGR